MSSWRVASQPEYRLVVKRVNTYRGDPLNLVLLKLNVGAMSHLVRPMCSNWCLYLLVLNSRKPESSELLEFNHQGHVPRREHA